MTEATRARSASAYEPAAYAPPDSRSIGPLQSAERLAFVDALRGIAILGVLVAYTMWNLGTPPPETWSRADRVIDLTLGILVDAKFVTLFAFLFGVGTAQQWRRIEAQGRDARPVLVRRMLFLLVAGLLHAVVLRNGDILAPYAILGFTLIAMRHWPSRRMAIASVVLALLPYALLVAIHATGGTLPHRPLGSVPDNSWPHYWADNAAWLRFWYLTGPIDSWPRLLALMLAGVLADRARLLPRLAVDRRLAWRMLAISLPLAIATRLAVQLFPAWWDARHAVFARGLVQTQTYHFSAWSLAATYVAALALVCQRPGWPARLAWLRAVGQMAFTNYLVQALLVVPICVAFGLFDAVTPTRGALLALGVAVIEIPCSVWWLRRFAYGPVEWLWRRVTYGVRPRGRILSHGGTVPAGQVRQD